jgi:hypothetical protein
MGTSMRFICLVVFIGFSVVQAFTHYATRLHHFRGRRYDAKLPIAAHVNRLAASVEPHDICVPYSERLAKYNKSIEIQHRGFSHVKTKLSALDDCDNYYSGQIGDISWHQNANQVLVHIPFANSASKYDIDIKFTVLNVRVSMFGSLTAEFEVFDTIIPHGSFWTIETDVGGKKYVQLDLEKRYILSDC